MLARSVCHNSYFSVIGYITVRVSSLVRLSLHVLHSSSIYAALLDNMNN